MLLRGKNFFAFGNMYLFEKKPLAIKPNFVRLFNSKLLWKLSFWMWMRACGFFLSNSERKSFLNWVFGRLPISIPWEEIRKLFFPVKTQWRRISWVVGVVLVDFCVCGACAAFRSTVTTIGCQNPAKSNGILAVSSTLTDFRKRAPTLWPRIFTLLPTEKKKSFLLQKGGSKEIKSPISNPPKGFSNPELGFTNRIKSHLFLFFANSFSYKRKWRRRG